MGGELVGDDDVCDVCDMRDEEHSLCVIEGEQGMLVLGDDKVIDDWLTEMAIPKSNVRDLKRKALEGAGKAAQMLGDAMADSGRWVKLTKDSAKLVKQYGATGAGVVRKGNGQIVAHLKFENLAKVKSLAGPQVMTGFAGIMTQMALEQAVAEITDYLKSIDRKINDLLRDQKDQTVSKLVGIARVVDETMQIHDDVGFITETTWSKIAGCPQDVASAQVYAMLKMENVARKLDEAKDAPETESIARQLGKDVVGWLSILANAIQLQDKLWILEIERVLTEEPETFERYRSGVIAARAKRLQEIEGKLNELNRNIRNSADRVRDQKLLHPLSVDATLRILDVVNGKLSRFASALGFEIDRTDVAMAEQWHVVAGKAITDGANQISEGVSSGVKQVGAGAKKTAEDMVAGINDTGRKLRGLFGR
ncbi:hypothetical protein COO72_06265 [Bifidobacterium callitrichos]|nr:hypothetical protein COO72_06265 [Bifidobacterium callitrichos]